MENKKIFIYIFSLLLIFTSCKTPEIENNAKYEANGCEFKFFPDSTFKYRSHKSCYVESSGTWRMQKNSIYLNSFNQTDKIPIEFKKIRRNNPKTILEIKVNSPKNSPKDYICIPIANDDVEFLYLVERGSYRIEAEIPIDSIYFSVIKQPFILRGTGSKMCYNNIKTEQIYPYTSVGDSLFISINIIDSLFDYKVFKDKELKVKHGKIIYREDDEKYKLKLKKQE